MPTTLEKTVREIALENPSSIRVFESLGIDYCCGGKKPLSDACFRANVDLARVVELLEQARHEAASPEAPEWRDKPLGELIAHVVEKHHAYVRQETPRIEGLLAKVLARHGADRPEIGKIDQLFSAISQELSTHMLKEEQVLFPDMERMEQAVQSGQPVPAAFFGTVKRPIANMVAEHDDARRPARTDSRTLERVPGSGRCLSYLFRALSRARRIRTRSSPARSPGKQHSVSSCRRNGACRLMDTGKSLPHGALRKSSANRRANIRTWSIPEKLRSR